MKLLIFSILSAWHSVQRMIQKFINSIIRQMNKHYHNHTRVLFILKRRHDYSEEYGEKHVATGMYNSVRLIHEMLDDAGVESHVVIVVDNNEIDKHVTKYKPTHVFIEGLWVVPEKFDVLKKLHKKVAWIVRCHSELPFLAQEGNAVDWVFEYLKRGIAVSGNSVRINDSLRSLAIDMFDLDSHKLHKILPLLPNYYPIDLDFKMSCYQEKSILDIGCFGAIRPLKNHLIQAVAAVEFAKLQGKRLRFHINSSRIEHGNSQLKNLRALFNHLGKDYKLVEHDWYHPTTFKKLLGLMDISMQVSLSESFNIVTADAVSVGTPVVVSSEIVWVSPDAMTKATDVEEIVSTMDHVLEYSDEISASNLRGLEHHSARAKQLWLRYLLH